MAKIFNTAGFCNPEDHYMVDPLKRLTDIEGLIKTSFTLLFMLQGRQAKRPFFMSWPKSLIKRVNISLW